MGIDEGAFQNITSLFSAAVDCSQVTSGVFDGVIQAFGTNPYGQNVQLWDTDPYDLAGIEANFLGQVCWPDAGVGFSLAGGLKVVQNFRTTHVYIGGTDIPSSEFYGVFIWSALRYAIGINLGGAHTEPNPSSYWSDLGLSTSDQTYYNN